MNSVKFTANGWTANLPAGWDDRSMITLVGETDASGFVANIVVTRERLETGAGVEQFAALQADLMRKEVAELQVLDERAITIKGLPSYQRLHRFAAGELSIQQVQTFIKSGDTVFVITGTATIEAFDRSIAAFKEFVETFQIEA